MFQSINYPVIGVDPSLNSLGYSYTDEDTFVTGIVKVKKERAQERLNRHYTAIDEIITSVGEGSLMVYEDYSIGSAGRGNNNAFKLGELGGVLKLLAWQRSVDVLLVPPTTLKVFIADNGRAEKPEVIQAIYDSYGVDFGDRDDEADAFGLMQMGLAHLSRRKPRSGRKKEALKGCTLILGKPPF